VKPRLPAAGTPAYDAWMLAERKAAEAERLLRQSRSRAGRRRQQLVAADPEVEARIAELRNEAASLFAQAMKEMDSAVEAALKKAHLRLH